MIWYGMGCHAICCDIIRFDVGWCDIMRCIERLNYCKILSHGLCAASSS